jgi:hypothetical protein
MREAVRLLAQELMEAKVSEQIAPPVASATRRAG